MRTYPFVFSIIVRGGDLARRQPRKINTMVLQYSAVSQHGDLLRYHSIAHVVTLDIDKDRVTHIGRSVFFSARFCKKRTFDTR